MQPCGMHRNRDGETRVTHRHTAELAAHRGARACVAKQLIYVRGEGCGRGEMSVSRVNMELSSTCSRRTFVQIAA